MELIFNPCSEFRLCPEGPVSHIPSPHLHVGAPGIFSDFLRSVQMLKREWGVKSNGKLPHLFIPNKTATLVPEFTVKDLPVGRTAALVPEFAVKDLHWAEHSDDDILFMCFFSYFLCIICSHKTVSFILLYENRNVK